MTFRTEVIKQASVTVPWDQQEAKITEFGGDPATNLLAATALPDGTVLYYRDWPTQAGAEAWVAWSLTWPGVVSGKVTEVV